MRQGLALGALIAVLLAPAAQAQTTDKLDQRLKRLDAGQSTTIRKQPGGPAVVLPGAAPRDGKVLVDVYVRGKMRDAAARLRARGMTVTAVSGRSPQRMVEGWLPIDRLEEVAGLSVVRAVTSVVPGGVDAGAQLSAGDARHRGPQVRALGHRGAGVNVGVISDTIDKINGGVNDSQSTGDLPPDPRVQVLADDPGPFPSDEGRAMAEIIYDTAPNLSKIAFSTGTTGAANKAASIDALVANGSDVIADDIFYLDQPMFQDGVVAQAVDRARAAGTSYFASAGNRARQSWEGRFTPIARGTPPAGVVNDFNTGSGTDDQQNVVAMPANRRLTLALQWDEPYGDAATDFAVDVYFNGTYNNTVNTNNIVSGRPVEMVTVDTAGSPTTVAIAIRRLAGSGTPRLKWIANTNFGPFTPAEYNTNSHAINPDAASSRGALAVAAVDAADAGSNTAEPYSSRGPAITRYLDAAGTRLTTPEVRAKPDVAGADKVMTTVPGFQPFSGTSASTPSVAGVATLLLSAKPSLSPAQMYAIMRDSRGTIDCTSAAGYPDADCGRGFILADGKLTMALDNTPPTVGPVLSSAPDGANGWYHRDVALSWNVADPQSPLATQTGCGGRFVATDGAIAVTCSATSAGGTTNRPVVIKRDTAPPNPPVITGIEDEDPIRFGQVPPESAVGCESNDATSGVESCVVSGYSAAEGSHELTAVATDESGLTSVATREYTVTPLLAGARGLKAKPKQRLGKVLRSGLVIRFRVGGDDTRVRARIAFGPTTCGRASKRFDEGSRSLRIKVNRKCRGKLRSRRRAKLKVSMTARGDNVNSNSARKTVSLKR